MPFGKFAPRNAQRLFENDLGQPRQSVTDLHNRQSTVEVGNRDTKHGCPLERGNCAHALLAVAGFVRQAFLEFGRDIRARYALTEQARIEEFVEKGRVARNLVSDVVAAAAQVNEPRKRTVILVEQ